MAEKWEKSEDTLGWEIWMLDILKKHMRLIFIAYVTQKNEDVFWYTLIMYKINFNSVGSNS